MLTLLDYTFELHLDAKTVSSNKTFMEVHVLVKSSLTKNKTDTVLLP